MAIMARLRLALARAARQGRFPALLGTLRALRRARLRKLSIEARFARIHRGNHWHSRASRSGSVVPALIIRAAPGTEGRDEPPRRRERQVGEEEGQSFQNELLSDYLIAI